MRITRLFSSGGKETFISGGARSWVDQTKEQKPSTRGLDRDVRCTLHTKTTVE